MLVHQLESISNMANLFFNYSHLGFLIVVNRL